ncbi:MAG: protocatechuate 3,4-dioxygenase [Bordetella sp. SCN 67-23]|nr:protocatechuate 3,4-dioxygenase [Burkholderiales bacterium]ODS73287.1 MAG: protocatechuate 3,4-dioxygenase [Bordetella sp. SCN 67-23]OJW92817.1 MAG: protocatechuate 3,4-dioxygenase [Burkholderiales bacterium 67-32]
MARIIGGIGTSHAPSLARAFDTDKRDEPEWKDLFTQFDAAKQWLKQARPDVIVAFYNDHLNQFFFDAYPTFAIGVGDPHPIADEGWGKRDFPDLPGHPALAMHVARSLVGNGFDMTICQESQIDHGILSPLPFLTDERWTVPVIPVQINVIQHPLPTARRCYLLGQAIREAVASFDQDLRVAVMGTGGLSHQLSGRRFGFVNPDWDQVFMERLASDAEALSHISHEDMMINGGVESVEVMMWLAMRGTLASEVRVVRQYYAAPMLTGYGLLVLEED